MNCARIYNTTMLYTNAHIYEQWKAYGVPQHTPTLPFLAEEHLLNGFFIYSLLVHHAEHQEPLSMNQDGEQRERLRPALQARNKTLEGLGQESYTHICDKCFYSYEKDGQTCKPLDHSCIIQSLQKKNFFRFRQGSVGGH